MKLKVLIVDDERLSRCNLELILSEEPLIEVVGSCARPAEVLPAVKEYKPDLLFLDIQMPQQNGLELMAALKKTCRPMPAVIFVTAHEHFAVDAFGLHAMDYLLKPFSDERLREAINHARVRLMAERDADVSVPGQSLPVIVIKERGQVLRLAVDRVRWVEAADHFLVMGVAGENHVLRLSLKEFLQRYEHAGFFQIHRSALVNQAFVQRLYRDDREQAWVVLPDGKRLRVSRRRYKPLFEALAKR